MSAPGTRLFVGPLSPAQRRRRERSRERFRHAQEIAEARCIPLRDAFYIMAGKEPAKYCGCWFSLNSGLHGECENCGLPASPARLNRK